jgi:hypothetical protein
MRRTYNEKMGKLVADGRWMGFATKAPAQILALWTVLHPGAGVRPESLLSRQRCCFLTARATPPSPRKSRHNCLMAATFSSNAGPPLLPINARLPWFRSILSSLHSSRQLHWTTLEPTSILLVPSDTPASLVHCILTLASRCGPLLLLPRWVSVHRLRPSSLPTICPVPMQRTPSLSKQSARRAVRRSGSIARLLHRGTFG